MNKDCKEREYVIVCNKSNGLYPGLMMFWGSRTLDNEKRSFAGYTCNADQCERYTLEEISQGGFSYLPVWVGGSSEIEFCKYPDIIIKYDKLIQFDWLTNMTVLYRQ